MRINLSPVNQVPKIECKKQQPRQISFGSSDEFVKKIYKSSLDEIKNEIQQKYQPAISQLTEKKNDLAKDVRHKVREVMYPDKNDTCGRAYFYRQTIREGYYDPECLKDEPLQAFNKLVSQITNDYIRLTTRSPWDPNGIMLVSKDKKLAEDILKHIELDAKSLFIMPNYNSDDDLFIDRCIIHRTCFETLKDTFGEDLASFQEALLDALEKAEERFNKTGNTTILHVENFENLIDGTKNDTSAIACMKDFMSEAALEFHTLLTFTNSDPSKSAPGTLVSHRVGTVFNLDELGITRKQLDFYFMDPPFKKAIEDSSKIYKEGSEEYIALTKQINDLQKQCQDELEEAEQAFLDKNLINRIIKKFKENKKTVIIVAAIVATLAAVGIILHKKGKVKKQILPASPQKLQKLEQAKTLQLQSNNMKNLMKPKSSDVFSSFQQ